MLSIVYVVCWLSVVVQAHTDAIERLDGLAYVNLQDTKLYF
jgi:hypothetical protein